MNEIAETLRKYLGGQEGIAKNEESRSSPREWTVRGKKRRRRTRRTTQTGRTRIMREEDDVERSAGRDREKSSEHAGCKGVRDR